MTKQEMIREYARISERVSETVSLLSDLRSKMDAMGIPRPYELPISKYSRGFTHDELEEIRKSLEIKKKVFYNALGINTGAVVDGQCLTYKCDVERALYLLSKPGGTNWAWD